MTISLTECVDRGVYLITSRNISVGVFRASTSGFIGIREKFNTRYLFEEFHDDDGGTAMPLKFIEMLPEEVEVLLEVTGHPIDGGSQPNRLLFDYLDVLWQDYLTDYQ